MQFLDCRADWYLGVPALVGVGHLVVRGCHYLSVIGAGGYHYFLANPQQHCNSFTAFFFTNVVYCYCCFIVRCGKSVKPVTCKWAWSENAIIVLPHSVWGIQLSSGFLLSVQWHFLLPTNHYWILNVQGADTKFFHVRYHHDMVQILLHYVEVQSSLVYCWQTQFCLPKGIDCHCTVTGKLLYWCVFLCHFLTVYPGQPWLLITRWGVCVVNPLLLAFYSVLFCNCCF